MPVRISGVLLPGHKRIEYALPYLYGIGLPLSKKIISEAHIDLTDIALRRPSLDEVFLALTGDHPKSIEDDTETFAAADAYA